ncbi:hypothetical protein SAMN05660649_03487 [Desulfotomaculum arcticum]|uniref:Uncharacterized protein n=1 Tax=Desulfotruncus arcticus DSM 17038 TaxID=1121424 RepID=A0A1I2WG92_9FIRM|nr:hypothetical protein SAMN05660649_03487 [Desulfotomaculum arcticum] [Desulfotruncus arcticus DSM 17038]
MHNLLLFILIHLSFRVYKYASHLSGVISGTPSSVGTSIIIFTVHDSSGQIASQNFSLKTIVRFFTEYLELDHN